MMPDLNLQEWSAIGQLALTTITFIGIAGSLFLSVRALREVQADRRQRQCPHLAFEGHGHQIPIEFVKAGTAVPGVNPNFAAQVFPDIPEDGESVRIKDLEEEDGITPVFFGRLKNYGLGPALETMVTWIPEKVIVGSETFKLDPNKLTEPRYSRALNSTPPWNEHIPPGAESELTRLPTFIDKDFEKKVTQVDGVLEITCKDVFGLRHTYYQDFYLKTGYAEHPPWVHVTFMEIRRETNGIA